MSGVLLLGTDCADVTDLASALDAHLDSQPEVEGAGVDWAWAEALEAWRDAASVGPAVDHIVVAPWSAPPELSPLTAIGLDAWVARAELALARWVTAFGVAKLRCADGGVVVAVVDRPAPLDSAGWAPESGIADAVEALTRSLARSEGPRRVRVDAVTTPGRLTRGAVVDPSPPLATFPGSVLLEAVGAVRLLFEADALGITGQVVHADCGRSWR